MTPDSFDNLLTAPLLQILLLLTDSHELKQIKFAETNLVS